MALAATGLTGLLIVGIAGTATAASSVSAVSSASPSTAPAGPGDGGAPAGSGVPAPATPDRLPDGIEDLSGYVPQSSCDPVAKPGAGALAALLTRTYPGSSTGITRACGADGIASEHDEGRAIDWMVSVRDPKQAAQAQAVISWLFAPDAHGRPYANARRLGVMYLIWNDRIWGAYATDSGWRPYSACAARPEAGYDTACHRNHVHISLSWAGAMARTSFWSGHVAAPDHGPCRPADLNWAAPYRAPTPSPCPKYPTVTAPAGSSPVAVALARWSGMTLGPGSAGPAASAVQAALGLPADGAFGPLTGVAVSAFRTGRGLAAGTTVDAATWRALLAAAAAGRVASPAGKTPAPAAGATATRPAAGPLSAYTGTVLSYGARGAAVSALQRVLRVNPVSGWFGPVTRSAVQAYQRLRKLPVTGTVDAATWRALTR